METTKQFLESYVCKSGETIIQVGDDEWEVQKWTTYTFKRVGNIYAAEHYDTHPPEAVRNLKLKPKSRRMTLSLSEHLLEEALGKGWLIQEIRLKKDGRTPLDRVYRMGPGLWVYEQKKVEEAEKVSALLKASLLAEVEEMKQVLPQSFLQKVKNFIEQPDDQDGWGKERVEKFTHFLLAYFQLRKIQERMDYKEIGATYYRKIGGSKVFDAYRLYFIARLEKWLGQPVQALGISSLGSIVPIYFTGALTGQFSHYSIGTVHATNDIAVSAERFQTTARVLWLVENRAVLTRMATEIDFLNETKSLVIGVDGQVRGAHRKMIQQLCNGNVIQQVMIWVDYDKAGSTIARDLVELINQLPYRLIGNEENVFNTYDAYAAWSKFVPDAEQEMTLGSEEAWRRWIERPFPFLKNNKISQN